MRETCENEVQVIGTATTNFLTVKSQKAKTRLVNRKYNHLALRQQTALAQLIMGNHDQR